MWVAPWRKVGVSLLIAALAASVYAAGRSGSVRTDASSFVEPVGQVEVVRRLAPATTTVVRPSGVVPARRVATSEASDVDLMSAGIRSALAAWTEFVSTADVTVLDRDFDPEGPQHRQLVSDVPLPGEAVLPPRFDLVGLRLAATTDATALVDTWIVLAVGDGSSVLRWRFHLTHHRDRWRVWTIEELAVNVYSDRAPSPAPR